MIIKRILLVFFLSFKFISSIDIYVPKNEVEREYLQNLKGKQLVLGIRTNYFTNDTVDDESLNDILEELLKSYLQLDIKIKKGNEDALYTDLKNGEVDLINFLTKTSEREEFATFSNKILDEELVVVSKDKNLNVPDDLNGAEVYITKNTVYEKFLERFKSKNELKMKVTQVDNITDISNVKYFVDTNLSAIGELNKLNISRLPESSIGIRREYEGLKKIIDSALEIKYNKKIENWIKKRRESVFKDKFFNSLTHEEKEYLKNLEPLKMSYGNIENVSTYSSENKKYVGYFPELLDYLFKKLSINIAQEKTIDKLEWPEIYEKFSEGKIDVLTLSKTQNREKDFIFTKKIYDLKIYQIESLKKIISGEKIGVIKNSIEESVAREHFLDSSIEVYTSKDKMLLDLKRNKLTAIISLDSESYDKKRFNVKKLENVPVNLALHRDKVILRDILNKFITEMVDLKDILKTLELNKKKQILLEKEKHRELIAVITLSCVVLLGLAAYQSFKVFIHKKKNRELLKDELTGLYSRRVYNEFCKNNSGIKGYTLLIDLNNFKMLNDTYGHDYGDRVLVEAGKILKEVFKNDFIFRISGDEFYIFSCYIADVKYKIEKLEFIFKNSELMKKFNISFSLGYYLKREKNSMEYAFKYADLAMYSAKKNKKIGHKKQLMIS